MATKAVILAAGQGTRMVSERPKVLHEIAGRPLVSWMLDALRPLDPDQTVVVVGYGADAVVARLPAGAVPAVQEDQLGTGHATRIALERMDLDPGDDVVVLPGDVPLLGADTVARLLGAHRESGAAATLLTTTLDDPTGYGRVLRNSDGSVRAVVEDRDATDAERSVREVNTSVYAFNAGALQEALAQVDDDNDQGEEYLTDVIGILAGGGATLQALNAPAEEVAGVNDQEQLAQRAAVMRRRINAEWMSRGVEMLDPDRVYLDVDVRLEAGARLLPGVHLEGATVVEAGAEVGPDVVARDAAVGAGARVMFSVVIEAKIGPGARVGPYAYLRPGTVLGEDAKAGAYVELKNAVVGDRSKVPHLSYIGDAQIGEDSNIGAATVTCNYDGYEKHATVVGDRVRIGSDTMLVAPVEIGDDAYTGAGSVISKDVPPGALGVTRSPQRNIPDYAARRKRRAERSGDA